MDAAVVVAIGVGLTGLGGLAAFLKVFADSRIAKRTNDTSAAGLASTLNATAQDWVKYIDGKFDAATKELDKHKRAVAKKDAARAALHQAHRLWDFTMKTEMENLTGKIIPDPPPLDVPHEDDEPEPD